MKYKKKLKPGDSYTYTRSSKHSLKFSNSTKLAFIKLLTSEYRRQMSIIIDYIYTNGFDETNYGFKSKTPKLFNISKESYSLPSFFPTKFLHLFSINSFLSFNFFQCIGKHVISLINSSIEKFLSDKETLSKAINYLESKNSKSKKLDKYKIRLYNLKILKPSCKSIPLLLNENHLDLLINNQNLFNTLDINKTTGELLYSNNDKNRTIFFNKSNILTDKREFDLFLGLGNNISPSKTFLSKWKELLINPDFINCYKDYYIKIEGNSSKLLKLDPEVLYKYLRYIKIPVKSTKIFNKWNELGNFNKSIELNVKDNYVKFSFTGHNKIREEGIIVGGDQGFKNVLTLSDKYQEFIQQTQFIPYKKNKFHSLEDICISLSNKKKGSKGFKKKQEHRKNFINQSINKLEFNNIKEIRYERVHNLRLGKRQRVKKMLHWSYPLIKNKLDSLSKSEGFGFKIVSNYYRSQRCCDCGWVQKENRKGSDFVCRKCSYRADADINAAVNLSLELHIFTDSERSLINKVKRVKGVKGRGFYWNINSIQVDEALFDRLDIGKYRPINPKSNSQKM